MGVARGRGPPGADRRDEAATEAPLDVSNRWAGRKEMGKVSCLGAALLRGLKGTAVRSLLSCVCGFLYTNGHPRAFRGVKAR